MGGHAELRYEGAGDLGMGESERHTMPLVWWEGIQSTQSLWQDEAGEEGQRGWCLQPAPNVYDRSRQWKQ